MQPVNGREMEARLFKSRQTHALPAVCIKEE